MTSACLSTKSDPLATRVSLLVNLQTEENQQAWCEFVELYAPMIHAYLRKRGVQDADAADLTQEVLHTISQKASDFSYDRNRGTFRGWLFTITLNRLRDFANRQLRQVTPSGKTEMVEFMNQLPDQEAQDLWDHQHQLHLFRWAADKVRPDFRQSTWQAFWRTAVNGQPVKQVALELDLSVGAVHIAKSRVMTRIREMIHHVESD